MKRLNKMHVLWYAALVLLIATGCSLFNPAGRERIQENEELTRGARFGRVVTAEGVGAGNEPVGVTDTFRSSQDFIYVVAEADYIEEGTSMFARWFYEGEPFEDSSEIVADRDYEDTYVEFHLESLEARMDEGDYSVTIFVNGNPAEEVDFEVR